MKTSQLRGEQSEPGKISIIKTKFERKFISQRFSLAECLYIEHSCFKKFQNNKKSRKVQIHLSNAQQFLARLRRLILSHLKNHSSPKTTMNLTKKSVDFTPTSQFPIIWRTFLNQNSLKVWRKQLMRDSAIILSTLQKWLRPQLTRLCKIFCFRSKIKNMSPYMLKIGV